MSNPKEGFICDILYAATIGIIAKFKKIAFEEKYKNLDIL